jgi:hypothetical protein
MRHLFQSFIICIVTLLALTGCSTKFDTAAPYQNITIVYGLLDQRDTAHYIRIQKTFLSQTLSAYNIEKVSDSSFYPQLNVVMKVINNGAVVGNPIVLTRIDLNLEGYKKDTGAFFTTPNYAYKFKDALNPINTYRLVITNPVTGVVDSAETTIIDEDPANFYCTALDIAGGTELSLSRYKGIFSVNGHVPSSVSYMQAILRVRWVDKNIQTGASVKHFADWYFATGTPTGQATSGGGNISYNLSTDNANFYAFLQTAIPPAPQFVNRLIDSAYLSINAANSDYYNYMNFTQTLGTGLTGSDIEPNYTDLKGKNVLGLYAGRGSRNSYIAYDVSTIDSIIANTSLKALNVTGSTY